MNKLCTRNCLQRRLLKLKLIHLSFVLFATVTVVSSMSATVHGQSEGSSNRETQTSTQASPPTVPDTDGVMASMFSRTGLLVMFGLMCFGLLAVRTLRAKSVTAGSEDASDNPTEGSNSGKVRPANSDGSRDRRSTAGSSVKVPASFHGAYRIKHEVAKLVLGHPHRAEVLSSRATEDMRAIETALLNFVISSESTDEERSRAREALEKYGYVARYCAALLRATDPFERTSAARSLGQMGSLSALPSLLDSLYDTETIVRNQSIASIGELKDPVALDALREVARICPDLPNHLLNRALNGTPDGTPVFNPNNVFAITQLKPASTVEDLPQSTNEERYLAAIAKVLSTNADERIEAVKILAEFPVQTSVASLTGLVRNDTDPSVRSFAVASLACINHESVFPAMLLALADESREVRASAARSMSRLSFDRSVAYGRLLETEDQVTLKQLATACVNSGIVSQNIDRLATSDRRQTYEAFTVISLLAKAQTTDTLVDAIANHPDMNVRLSVIHLLAATGQWQVSSELHKLSGENVPEEIKTALLEALYKLRATSEESAQDLVEPRVY
jgi:HEAT repeat protein